MIVGQFMQLVMGVAHEQFADERIGWVVLYDPDRALVWFEAGGPPEGEFWTRELIEAQHRGSRAARGSDGRRARALPPASEGVVRWPLSVAVIAEKACHACGLTKPANQFSPLSDSRGWTGLRSECRSCAAARARRQYAANREEILRRQAATRARDREASRARSRAKHARNRAQETRRKRARYAENAAAIRAEARARRAVGDEASRAYARGVLLHDPCAYCGGPSEHLDHVEPVAAGGDMDWTNLTAACRRCNQSKGTRGLLLWLARR